MVVCCEVIPLKPAEGNKLDKDTPFEVRETTENDDQGELNFTRNQQQIKRVFCGGSRELSEAKEITRFTEKTKSIKSVG